MRRPFPILLLLALVLPARMATADSTWVDHYRAALASHAAGELPAFRDQMLRVGDLIGEQPGVNYNLACAAARLGDRDEALRRLELYAASGLIRNAAADSDFVSLWDDGAFQALARRIQANGDSIGDARVAHRFSDPMFLTEDLAHDPATGAFYVTSIHRGCVIEVAAAGRERLWRDPERRPGWGCFAAGIDARCRLLWVSVAATPTTEGYAEADSGRTGLVAWDLRTRRVVRRVEGPRDGTRHLLGDLTVGPDGSVYASDGLSGAVRVLRPGADTLATLVPDGTFGSPQQPALSADGRRIYVAEYSRGIATIELASGHVDWLGFAPGIALQGIDGLVRHGDELIVVQNGTRPRRVMRLALDRDGRRVTAATPVESGTSRLGEPTHGVVVGGDFCFLANTGWNRVGADERLGAEGATPAKILRTHVAD